MKKGIISFIAMLLLSNMHVFSQGSIFVEGYAEVTIPADRITVSIELKEYFKNESLNQLKKVTLNQIESSLRNKFESMGVGNDDISVVEITAFPGLKNEANLIGEKIEVTFKDNLYIDAFTALFNQEGVEAFEIINLSNSEMSKYDKEGLGAALHHANTKAKSIVNQVGGKIGVAMKIEEDAKGCNEKVSGIFNQSEKINFSEIRDIIAGNLKFKKQYKVKVEYSYIY